MCICARALGQSEFNLVVLFLLLLCGKSHEKEEVFPISKSDGGLHKRNIKLDGERKKEKIKSNNAVRSRGGLFF